MSNSKTEEPRAFTAREVRHQVLDHIHELVDYWHNHASDRNMKDRMESLVFSILNIFDGTVPAFPRMDIVLSPHEDGKEFCRGIGENWYEPGMVINDCAKELHHLWYNPGDDVENPST